MAGFTSNSQTFTPSLPFMDNNSSMELLNQLPILNTSFLETQQLSAQNLLSFSHNNFYCQQSPGFLGNLEEIISGNLHPGNQNYVQVSESNVKDEQSRKRKSMDMSESSSRNSHAPFTESGSKRNKSSGRGKRVKNNENGEEKSKEVVHVRARRGQATDSHSLAERVRRQKINERLKCLQNIVPGCYKTMGMAGMLDEIINYVQSLQNQVEFLSMKLSTASSVYDFNSQTEPIETIQRANASEVKELERLMMMGIQGGGVPGFQLGWPF